MKEREIVHELLSHSFYSFYYAGEFVAIEGAKQFNIDLYEVLTSEHKNIVKEIDAAIKVLRLFFEDYNKEIKNGTGNEINDFLDFKKHKIKFLELVGNEN